jgi:hypothetical protein
MRRRDFVALLGSALAWPDPKNAEATTNDLQTAARTLGCDLQVLNAGTEAELDPAFATFGRAKNRRASDRQRDILRKPQ